MLALSNPSATLGQRTYLSTIDVFQLNKLYSCHGLYNSLSLFAVCNSFKNFNMFSVHSFFCREVYFLFNFHLHIDDVSIILTESKRIRRLGQL